jgi:alpha-ketoglutarate-dependent taurine dioxygenase
MMNNTSKWITDLFVVAYLASTASGFSSITAPPTTTTRIPQARHLSPSSSSGWLRRGSDLPTRTTTTSLPYQTGGDQVVELLIPPSDLFFQRQETNNRTLSSSINPGPTPIDLQVVHTSNMGSKALPLILKPTTDDQQSTAFIQSFLRNNRQWVSNRIEEHGAIMFRGFDIKTASDVEETIRSYNPYLNNEYRGTSPRNTIDDTKFVFSAAEVPSSWPIAQHIEMSFLPSPPRQLYFSALQAPTTVGGETALADFRKVYNDLPHKLRNKLAAKKLRYRRTHKMYVDVNEDISTTHDVAALQTWPALFGGITNKRVVERMALEENPNATVRWEGTTSSDNENNNNNNTTFVSEFTAEAFRVHPETGEMVWFNHANVFHWTSFPAELVHAFCRTKDVRFLRHAIQVGLKSIWKYGIRRQKMALHVDYGDGTPISIWEMHQIRKAIHKNMVFNRWQQGDLIFIDNFSTSHGRQPTYDSGRKIVVAWSDPTNKN